MYTDMSKNRYLINNMGLNGWPGGKGFVMCCEGYEDESFVNSGFEGLLSKFLSQ